MIKGRQNVKKVLKRCITPGKTADLPGYCVNCNHAFEHVSIDYCGPLYCRNIFSSSRDVYICYVLLTTCAVTRGVHLELTTDASAKKLILVLKRFTARGKS